MRPLFQGGTYFEGPRWHEEEVVAVEGEPSGLGWMPDGSLLVSSRKDHRILRRRPGGELIEHADVSEHCGGDLNDLVVDPEGRAYVGNFGFDLMNGADPATTNLVRVDPDGAVTVVADELLFPNGTVIFPDGVTLVVGETAAARFTGFTIAPDGVTRRTANGPPPRSASACAGLPRTARYWRRSRRRTAWACSPACWAARTAARCCCAAHPTRRVAA